MAEGQILTPYKWHLINESESNGVTTTTTAMNIGLGLVAFKTTEYVENEPSPGLPDVQNMSISTAVIPIYDSVVASYPKPGGGFENRIVDYDYD